MIAHLHHTANGSHMPLTETDLIAALHARIVELERRLDAMTKPQPVAAFTARENDIMRALEDGYTSYREIAERLIIAETTVKTHLNNMRRKVGVASMGELLAWRMRQNATRNAQNGTGGI